MEATMDDRQVVAIGVEELDNEALDQVSGGHGGSIDPNGSESDSSVFIDPNG
jgi:bacteriocin-like protein